METVPASSYLLLHNLLFQNGCKVFKEKQNIVRMQRVHLLLVSACHSDYLQVSKSKQCSETCQTAPFLFRTSGFSRQAGSTKKLPENSKEYYKSRKNDTTHSNGVVWSHFQMRQHLLISSCQSLSESYFFRSSNSESVSH